MAAISHNELTLFIVQASSIIALSRGVGLLARKVGQPMVVAEVLAGILLGPSFFGALFPVLSSHLFPLASLPSLHLVAQIGLVFFMFLIGLELDPGLMRGRGKVSLAISTASILTPFGLGGLLAIYLYPRLSDGHAPFSSFALFMGTAMSITAFPVLARILAERQLLRSRVGVLTITCAAINDATAWCILAFVVSIARSLDLTAAIWTTLLAATYIAAMVFVARPFLRRLGARGSNRDGLTQNMVAVTFLMLMASAWATERIGIHALFGAFVLGAVIPKEGGFAQTLGEKLEDFVVVFLLPLFFAYTGLRTQIGLIDSPERWMQCGLLILVACVGKFGGSAIPARLAGLSWREAGALGILMNTRGLMELIVLNIGLDLGVISPALFTMMVIMAVTTTFITTPLLQLVYPDRTLGGALGGTLGETLGGTLGDPLGDALGSGPGGGLGGGLESVLGVPGGIPGGAAAIREDRAGQPSLRAVGDGAGAATDVASVALSRGPSIPSARALEKPSASSMSSSVARFTVLMCVSYDRTGPSLVALAGALAGPDRERSRLYALRLIRPSERTSFYLRGESGEEAVAALRPLLDKARDLELPVTPLSFVSPDPGRDICNVAEVKGADLLLLGWHRPLLSQTVLGGTVYEVMEQARADVAVLIDRGLTSIQRVLVPYYGSAHDRAALGLARRLAKQVGADVTILHVVSPERAQDDPRLGVKERMEEVFSSSRSPRGQVTLQVVEHADPAEAALNEAANGYDLVMIGVGPEWGLEQRQFGIRPEHIIERCPTSLLVVRQYEPPVVEEKLGASA